MSKPRKKPVKWARIVTTTIKDPRVDASKLEGRAHLEIVVADMIDELGRRWRQYDDGPAELLGYAPPPPANADGG